MKPIRADMPAISLREVAELLMSHRGLFNPDRLPGSILSGGGTAWRHAAEGLTEVRFQEYEQAIASANSNDWPPYAAYFELAPEPASRTLTVHFQNTYDIGLVEGTRGGMAAEVTLVHDGKRWQIARINDTMFSD